MRVTQEALNSPPPPGAKASEWARWCLDRLEQYESAAARDPLTNSVRRLAYDLAQLEAAGEVDHARLAATAKAISDEALIARADKFGAARVMGEGPHEAVGKALRALEGAPFDEARRLLERANAGLVFTAHPTFAMSRALRAAFSARAEARSEVEREAAASAIAALAHAPDTELLLVDEHHDALAAVERAQTAIRGLIRACLDWARTRYPDEWAMLTPAPLSLATWVGYDLDGRTDIHWSQTFRLRLEEKARQLGAYAESLRAIEVGHEDRDALAARLEEAAFYAAEQAAFFAGDFNDPAIVTKAANALTKDDPRKLVSLSGVVEALDGLIEAADGEARLELCVLRAEMRAYGLGVARIHLRINAAQIRSALRADLGLDPARGFLDRTALTAAAKKTADAASRRINLGSIFLEQMTARRQFMLCAEFVKHIDSDTPIRFLIAECEAPATVMGAIYLAKLYGIDRILDISPLFETPEAIERGGRFIERLLAEPEFVDYIRARGRIAIQLGFSDSGRFMGQAPAELALERLQILLARALGKAGIRDIEAIVFNTHGESMGRGGFPGGLGERFDYLMTPWARSRFAANGLALSAECSFQGGDGYLHFETENLAQATVNGLFEWGVKETPPHHPDDRFYTDINYSWDFYRAVKAWQEALFENSDYQLAIGAFAPAMLFTTGSRRARRQSGSVTAGARALRAIPHNAILQQLAAPANVFGGVGAASGAEPDRLLDLVKASPRARQIMTLARRSRALTSLPALRAYAALFDATFWVSKAAASKGGRVALCEELAAYLASQNVPTALGRFANLLAADLLKIDRIFRELEGDDVDLERRGRRRAMHALHAIRQAMIMRGFLLAASLPAISPRHDVSRARLFDYVFELRFDELADLLETIFPAVSADETALAGIEEPADDIGDSMRGYPEIHAGVIKPLRDIHRSIREIGVGLSHFYGAYG